MTDKTTLFKKELSIDLKELLTEMHVAEDVFIRILKISIETTEEDLASLKAYIEEGNREKAEETSHKLKGVYANMRITPLYKIAADMYSLARSEQGLSELNPLLDLFSQNYSKLKAILD
ncbi:MAG: Hpt domain-containing protein [Candidatus Omnitrophica bacterium]|nr:Hpt domain-containing protein [Candidatus Omnitrophota bacterium]